MPSKLMPLKLLLSMPDCTSPPVWPTSWAPPKLNPPPLVLTPSKLMPSKLLPLMVEVVLIEVFLALGFDGEDFRLREEPSHRVGSAAVSQGTPIGNTERIR